MKIDEVTAAFMDSTYPLRKVPQLSAVALYDDENFTDYDFDVIGPKPRKFLTSRLKTLGFQTKGSREFIGSGLTLKFHRPKGSLGVHPMADLSEILLDCDEYFILTPTEAVLALILCGQEIDKDELCEFVFTHPINFNKIKKWSKNLEKYALYQAMIPDLKDWQRRGIEDRKSNILNRMRRNSSAHSDTGDKTT